MIAPKPMCSLSLDLDNKWSYLKTHGEPGWEKLPSYLDIVVPRVLNILRELNLTITVFVVGQDAALTRNHETLRAIATAGHEIGNHSFRHEPWLHLYSEQEIETEVAQAEEHIERATGKKPIGFRGPGFSVSYLTLRALARRGYLYDASTFPTFLVPLARMYYFMTARFTPEEKRQRRRLGGTAWDGFRPLRPYRWRLDTGPLLEIPVTTMPIVRMPIHASYLLCLSLLSPAVAFQYFNLALTLCRLTHVQPSLLLHPTDFLGCDDTRDLSFFPGMGLPHEKKVELTTAILRLLSAQFAVRTLQQHASEVSRLPNLPIVAPRFGRHPSQSAPPPQARLSRDSISIHRHSEGQCRGPAQQ